MKIDKSENDDDDNKEENADTVEMDFFAQNQASYGMERRRVVTQNIDSPASTGEEKRISAKIGVPQDLETRIEMLTGGPKKDRGSFGDSSRPRTMSFIQLKRNEMKKQIEEKGTVDKNQAPV